MQKFAGHYYIINILFSNLISFVGNKAAAAIWSWTGFLKSSKIKKGNLVKGYFFMMSY